MNIVVLCLLVTISTLVLNVIIICLTYAWYKHFKDE